MVHRLGGRFTDAPAAPGCAQMISQDAADLRQHAMAIRDPLRAPASAGPGSRVLADRGCGEVETRARMRLFAILVALALVSAPHAGASRCSAPSATDTGSTSCRRATLDRATARRARAHRTPSSIRSTSASCCPTATTRTQQRRYPVLYLFHGTSGRASGLGELRERRGNHRRAADDRRHARRRASTATAAAGSPNWFNGGAGGQPMWETFHVEQVIPWIDANLRTIDVRARGAPWPGSRRAASARSAMRRATPTCSRRSPRSPAAA